MNFNYTDHERDIRMYVRRWIQTTSPHLFADLEDYLQEGAVAFLKCQEGYKEEYPFKPWLRRSIFNHLNNTLKPEVRYHKTKQEVRENPLMYEEYGVAHTVSYEQSDCINITRHRDSEEEEVYRDSIWSLIESCGNLTEEEESIVQAYVDCGGNYRKTGESLGITKQGVHFRLKSIINKLRDFSQMKEG